MATNGVDRDCSVFGYVQLPLPPLPFALFSDPIVGCGDEIKKSFYTPIVHMCREKSRTSSRANGMDNFSNSGIHVSFSFPLSLGLTKCQSASLHGVATPSSVQYFWRERGMIEKAAAYNRNTSGTARVSWMFGCSTFSPFPLSPFPLSPALSHPLLSNLFLL